MPLLKPPKTEGGGGPFPPPAIPLRRDWTLVTGPTSGGWTDPVPHPTDISVTWRLTDGHEANFKVQAGAGYDATIGPPLATDLHILYAGRPVFRGRIGRSSDVLSAAGHAVSFTAFSYRTILEHRLLFADSILTFTGDLADAIVWGLISQTQGRAGGALGLVKGAGFPFGSTGEKVCAEGDVIAEKVDEVGAISPGGYEWDITPHDAVQQTVDLWANARAANRGVVFQYGDGITGNTWTRDLDPSNFANAGRITGGTDKAGKSPDPVEIETAGLDSNPAGRWDALWSTEETTAAALRARAVLSVEGASALVPSYTIPLRPGRWLGPDHIWIGDVVRVVPRSGRLAGISEIVRVLELEAAIGADQTTVTLTLGAVPPDTTRELKRLTRELRKARRARVAGRNPRPMYVLETTPAPPD